MRGRGAKRARGEHRFKYRNGERRALDGVGPRAELVDEDEAFGRHFVEDPDERDHMRRERGERLLDRLFVADVAVDLVEHADFRAALGGDVKTRLRHYRKQPEGLERYGLAAGVRPGDNEHPVLAADVYRDGSGLFAVEKRVARLFQHDLALFGDLRLVGVEIVGELRAAEDEREQGYVLIVERDLLRDGGDERGKLE